MNKNLLDPWSPVPEYLPLEEREFMQARQVLIDEASVDYEPSEYEILDKAYELRRERRCGAW